MPANSLQELFYTIFSQYPVRTEALSASGSNRKYFRMKGNDFSIIGVHNNDFKENQAFIGFTKHFLAKQFDVPQILAEDLPKNIYLLNDLGDETLYSYRCFQNEFTLELKDKYKEALKKLLVFQTKGNEGLDYSLCYPRAAFDEQSIYWDLNYFKYYFLKLAHIPFDEQLLEDDFKTLTNFLLEADSDYFLFRDFQSRNIMLHQDKLYFIDYQGGRKGALPYDVASLLYDGKADIPPLVREEMLEYYIQQLVDKHVWSPDLFRKYYYGFVLIRIMQAMGSYGYRGFYERKEHFLQSIPFALKNLTWILENVELPIKIPTLRKVFELLIDSPALKAIKQQKLNINIKSFSYRQGIPADESGNGGGFVFDCRCLPNPGRCDQYRKLTGKNQEVIAFLEKEKDVILFFEHVKSILDQAVKNYIERDFSNLFITFGCTGGQHRSVFFAEKTLQYLLSAYPIKASIEHTAEKNWNI